jgi:UDP-glucose:(heptosyl)LPS alpha-1,3-glucosyltransferase
MKIAFAYATFSDTGGIERASRGLAATLAKRGHTVDFHCAEQQADAPPGVMLRLHHIPSWPHALRIAAFARAASAGISRTPVDIVHAHGALMGADVITAHSCHRAGLSAQKLISGSSSRPQRNLGLSDAVRLRQERAVFTQRRYGAVIAVSGGVRDELMREYGVPSDDVVVIPNGVDCTRFDPAHRARDRKPVLERYGIPQAAIVFLFVGNEFHRKGLQECILGLVDADRLSAHLLVTGGDDPLPFSRLAQECGVADRVHFAGKAPDVERLFGAADAFLFPTAYEAFSLAMIEAAAAGLPLLLTPVNGAVDLLTGEAEGLFIQRTRESVAHVIRAIADDPTRAEAMGRAARAKALDYTWEKITDRTLELYARVLGQKGIAGHGTSRGAR